MGEKGSALIKEAPYSKIIHPLRKYHKYFYIRLSTR